MTQIGTAIPALFVCLALGLTGCAALERCGLRECAPDARISDEVRGLFGENSDLGGPNEITVQTHHGVVYLRGLVSTPYQLAEAGSIARRAAGVTSVQNLLSIDNSR